MLYPHGDDGPRSEVSVGQLLEHRLVQLRLGQQLLFNRAFSISNSRHRLAPSAFIPPYWLRRRLQVASLISK